MSSGGEQLLPHYVSNEFIIGHAKKLIVQRLELVNIQTGFLGSDGVVGGASRRHT